MNIKEQIENQFNVCATNHCIEFYTTDFDVDDRTPSTPCYKVNAGTGEFSIENNGNLVYFLKVDACILFGNDGQKCDLAVFTENEFVFIELKIIEIGTKVNAKKRTSKRNNAYEQLEKTLEEFIINRGIDFSKYQNEGKFYAVAAVLDTNPPISKMPAAKTGNFNQEQKFQQFYNAQLLLGNSYTFEFRLGIV